MNPFDTFFYHSLQQRAREGLKRELKPIHIRDSVHFEYQGRQFINFSGNDYLGLSNHPAILARSHEYLEAYGTGSGASRLITGHTLFLEETEKKLADFLGAEAALIFPSGWQTNVGVIASLIENLPKPVWVLTDRLNHASLHYGCKAGQARQIRFRHNDMEHLRERLETIADEAGTKLIITETIFSMDGDQADCQSLRKIADQYQAFLFLDDAHATGVFGSRGQGLAPAYADLTMGTFSKAWGGMGAYIAGSRLLCDWIINFCSGFIHTTALPPAAIGGIAAALDIMPTLGNKREFLAQQSNRVKQRLQYLQNLQNNIMPTETKQINNKSIGIGASVSQIIPVMVGSSETASRMADALKEKGIWIMPIRPPTVPLHSSRLRLTISAAHTENEIGHLLDSLDRIIRNEK